MIFGDRKIAQRHPRPQPAVRSHQSTERTVPECAPPETIRPQLEAAVARGLLEVSAERLAPTALGRRFLNDLLQLFLPERAEV